MSGWRKITLATAKSYTVRRVFWLDRRGDYHLVRSLRKVGPNVQISLADGKVFIPLNKPEFYTPTAKRGENQ